MLWALFTTNCERFRWWITSLWLLKYCDQAPGDAISSSNIGLLCSLVNLTDSSMFNCHRVTRSLLGCSWCHCNVFVNYSIESDLYMKVKRNAVCTSIGFIMTLNALRSHFPTVSQGLLTRPGGVKRNVSDLVWTADASLGLRTMRAL